MNAESQPEVGCFTRLFSLNRKSKGTPSTETRTKDLTRCAPLPVCDVKTVPLNSVPDEELVSLYL